MFFFFNYIFFAVLGLHCCEWAFSRYGERGYSSCVAQASHYGGFSCCRARALGAWASVVVARGLICPMACGIFLDQGSNQCSLR